MSLLVIQMLWFITFSPIACFCLPVLVTLGEWVIMLLSLLMSDNITQKLFWAFHRLLYLTWFAKLRGRTNMMSNWAIEVHACVFVFAGLIFNLFHYSSYSSEIFKSFLFHMQVTNTDFHAMNWASHLLYNGKIVIVGCAILHAKSSWMALVSRPWFLFLFFAAIKRWFLNHSWIELLVALGIWRLYGHHAKLQAKGCSMISGSILFSCIRLSSNNILVGLRAPSVIWFSFVKIRFGFLLINFFSAN